MRNYALNHAVARDAHPAPLLSWLSNWRARRNFTKLLAAGEAVVRQHGFDPDDLKWAITLPLDCNPQIALEDRMFHRALVNPS
jgi:hypothetical protein